MILVLTLMLLTQQSHAAAASSGITYTGRILDSSDQPVTASQVYFTITISDPDQKCWLYTEQRLVDMSSSAGNFSFEVGSNDPTTLYGTPSLNNPLGGGPATFADLFDNTKSFSNLAVGSYTSCTGTYDPSTATDKYSGRVMAIFFRIGAAGTDQALPALRITPVPMAMQAINSVKVNGYDKDHLLKIDPTIASPVNSDINATQLAEFFRLVNNPGTAYLSSVPSMGGDVTGTVAANTVAKIQNVAVTAPTTGDTGKVLTYNGTNLVWQTAATSAITAINGLTGATQSFAIGTSGTDVTITSSGSTHTIDVPSASASNRGVLTSADWSTFNAKQSSSLANGSVWIGNASGGAQAQTLSGDATVSASGNVTVDKTQTAQASKILQLDSSGNAYVNGVDIKGSGAVAASIRYTGASNMVMNLPTTSGTANQFLQTDGAGNLSWASQSAMLPAISAGQVWVGNASGGAEAFSLSGDVSSVSNTGLVTLTSSATGANKLPLAGGTMSGAINMGGQNISNAGDVSLAAGKFLGLGAGSTDGTVAGQIWYDAGVIKYFDGTTAKSLGVAGAGITNINGLTAGTQSFAIGTAGNAPAFTSATSTHTLDIPMASASGTVTAGLISNADYVSFSGKQSNSLAAGEVWVGNASGVSEARALSGDIFSVSNTGLVTVNKTTTGQSNYIMALDGSGVANAYGVGIKGATSGTVTLQAPTTVTNYSLTYPAAQGGANQVLSNDGSGVMSWMSVLTGITNSASLTNGKLWIGNASGVAAEVAMSGDATIDNAGLLTLKNTGTVGTYSKVVTDAQGRVVSGSALASGDVTTALGFTPVNVAGDSMSGDLITQNISMVPNKYLGLSANSTDGTVAGQMWYDTGVIKYFDGTTVKSLGVAGAGITTLNGLSSVTQTFAVGTAGTDFAITSSGSGHTFDLPSASASNRGALTSADWSTFNAKQSNALTAASVWVGNASGGAEARALSGDVTIDNVGLVTLKNTGSVGSYYKVVTDAQGRVVSGSTSLGATDMPALNDGTIWIGNSGNTAVGYAMSGDATMSNVGLLTLKNTGSVGTYSKVVTDAQGRVVSGSALASGDVTTALGFTPVNVAGDTMAGALNFGANDISNTGNISMAANKYFGLSANGTDGTVAGQMWYDAGVIKYYDGTTVKSLGVAGAGITTLNGLSSVTQSFIVGSAGNAPAITSSGSGHTFDFPMASASGSVTAGLISNADYVSFSGKQSTSLAAGEMWVGNASGVAQAFSLSGDVASVSNTGLVTVNKSTTGQSNYIMALDGSGVANAYGVGIKGATSGTVTLQSAGTTANYSLTFPAAQGGANQVLSNDGSGVMSWVTALTGITDSAALTNGKLWIGNASGVAAEVNVSGDATMDNAGVMTLKNTGTVGTYFKVVTDAQGRVTSGAALASGDVTTALGFTPVNVAGDTMAGNLNMGAGNFLGLGASAADGTVAGQIWYDGGAVKYFDGTTAKTLGVAGAGITNLNGLSSGTQSFVVGTAGTDFAITSSGSGHTFDLPSASASNRGALTSADWSTFNAKQSNSLSSASVWVGNSSGGAEARALSGDVTIDNVGLVTLKNTGSVGSYYKVVTDAQGRVVSGSTTLGAADLPALNDGTIWIGNSGNTAVGYAMSGDATMSNVGLLTLKNTGSVGTYSKVVTDAQGRVVSGSALASGDVTTALGFTPVNVAGDSMSGDLITQNISMVPNKYFGLSANSTDGTVAGQMWYDAGTIKYFDGSTVKSLGVAGAGITSLNGLSAGTQSFAIGTAGNAPAFTSATSTHTLDIPMASASGSVTAGLISNADYVSFSGKQSSSLAAGQMWVGNASGVAQAFSLSGDVASVSNTGLVTVNKSTTGQSNYIMALDGSGVANAYGVGIKGATSGTVTLQSTGTTANYSLTFPAAQGGANQVLSNDGSGILSWATALTGITNSAALTNGKLWIGNASGVAAEVNVSGDATMDNAGVMTLKNTGTVGTYFKVVTDAQGRVTSGAALASGDVTTALGFTPVNVAGDTMAGNLNMGAGNFLGLGASAADGTVAGQIWYDAGAVKYFDGTTAKTLGVAGAGITNLNGLSVGTQSFVAGTSGSDFAISSAGSSHTFNLPSASASNRGALTSADWSTFNAKQSNSLSSASVWVGNSSGGAEARALSGDVTIDNVGLVSLKNTGSVGTYYKVVTDAQGRVVSGSTSLGATDMPALNDGTIWIGNSGNTAVGYAMSGDATMSNVGLLTLKNTGTVGTYFKVVTDAQGRVTSGSALASGDVTTALGYTPVNRAGDTMAGALNFGGFDISNTGNISMAANKYFGLSANGTDGTVAGQMWYDSGTIKYFDGSTVKSLGVAGAGITSLNGLSSGTQSFAIGTAGNAPAFTSATSTHTLDIPMASASGSVTAGLISNADYVSFSGKQSSSLAAGQMWVGNASGVAQAFSLSGDVASVSNTGSVTVNKTTTGQSNYIMALDGSGVANAYGFGIKGATSGTVTLQAPASPANYSLTFPAAQGAANQVLSNDGSGVMSWATALTGITNQASLTNGKLWIGNASGKAAEVNVSGDATMDNAGVMTLKNTGTVGTYFKVVTDAQGRVTSGSALASGDVTTALGFTPVNIAGDTMTGDLGTLNINMAANKYLKLSANSTDGTVAGQMWYDTGTIKYYDGSTVKSLGVAGAGITTLNGLTAVSQTFVTGTSGTDFNLSFSGSTHTFNLPSASASNRGALTSADWSTFNSKQSNSLTSASVWVGNSSGGAEARALSGDVTISNVGLVTLKNTGTLGTYFKVVTDAQGRVTSGSASLSNTDMPTLADTKIWIGNSSSTATPYAISGDATMSNVGLLTLKNTGTVGTYFKVVTDAQGRVTSGSTLASGDVTTALGYTPVNRAGDTMTGALNFGGFDITNTGAISMANNKYFTVSNYAGAAGTAAGQLWYDSGSLKYYNGSSAVTLAASGAAITSLNGLTSVAQTFAIGTTGNSPAFSSATNTHTLNIPMASASGSVTAGLLSNAEYVTLSGKQSNTLASTQVWVGNSSGGAQARALSGDITIDNVGLVTLKNTGTLGTYFKVVTDAQGRVTSGSSSLSNTDMPSLADTKIWIGNGSSTATPYALSGDATMSNVGLVTVAKTTTGQSNYILALDGSGVANAYGVGYKGATSGTVTLQAAATTSTYSLKLPSTTPTANQVMASDASGNLSWATALTSANGYMNGGNTFAGNATIGLNDAYTLGFKTNSATRMTITAAGKVGIGTATPAGTFEVQGGTAAASTTGAAITLQAQDGGSGGATGGSINLTPGAGSSGWPGGSVVVSTINGVSGAISANNNLTNSYATSSGSSTTPSYVMKLANSYNANGNTALINGNVKNSSANYQEGYMGFVSVTGAANYSPDFVLGLQSGSNAYQERMRVVGSTGNVGIFTSSPSTNLHVVGNTVSGQSFSNVSGIILENGGSSDTSFIYQIATAVGKIFTVANSGKVGIGTTSFSSNLLEVNGTVGATGANMSGAVTSTVASASTAFDAGNGNIKAGAGGTSVAGGGQIYAGAYDNTAGATIDFNKGNIQTTSYACAGAITLNNMQSGGSYTLVVTDTTSSAKCVLKDGASTIADTQFAPTNTTRTSGKTTIYTLIKVGSTVYVSWIPGFGP